MSLRTSFSTLFLVLNLSHFSQVKFIITYSVSKGFTSTHNKTVPDPAQPKAKQRKTRKNSLKNLNMPGAKGEKHSVRQCKERFCLHKQPGVQQEA